jgi:hypothetical protein
MISITRLSYIEVSVEEVEESDENIGNVLKKDLTR